jgi:hypothetical protein
MKTPVFLQNFGQKISFEKKGVIYPFFNILCLLLITVIFLSGLHNMQNAFTNEVSTTKSSLNWFSFNPFLRGFTDEKRIILLLDGLKWQFWIFILILLKNFLLCIKKNWSFIFSNLVLIVAFVVTTIYYQWTSKVDEYLYLTFVPRWFLELFNLNIFLLLLADILIILILLFKKKDDSNN